MISIAARAFDPAGHLLIQRPSSGSQIHAQNRRVTRTATLDGGAVAYDTGAGDGDRTFRVVVSGATSAQVQTAARLVTLYPQVTVAVRDGVFLAIPESYVVANAELTLTLLALRKL